MITFKQGFTDSIKEGMEAEIHTANGKSAGKVLRDQEGHLEVLTNEMVSDGEVIVVVKDGSDSSYSGVLKDGKLTVGPVNFKENKND